METPDNGEERDDLVECITLEYEDGTSMRCEVLGCFEYGDGEYVAVAPVEDDESVYLYTYTEYEDGSFSIGDIDDDIYDDVVEEYEQIVDDLAEDDEDD